MDDVLIDHRSRRIPPKHNQDVRSKLEMMLDAGIVTPAVPAWPFTVVIAAQKDGSLKFCVDYHTVHRKMKPDKWSLLLIEEVFDDLAGTNWFTTLDLFSGYWHIKLADNIKEKTIFIYKFSTSQFEVMPFGLMNAPCTYQRMMDSISAAVPFISVYLDDIAVFSNASDE